MEQINEELKKMQTMENIKQDSLKAQVKPLCVEYCEIEYEESKFPFSEEDHYPPLCVVQDTNHLKDEISNMNLLVHFLKTYK